VEGAKWKGGVWWAGPMMGQGLGWWAGPGGRGEVEGQSLVGGPWGGRGQGLQSRDWELRSLGPGGAWGWMGPLGRTGTAASQLVGMRVGERREAGLAFAVRGSQLCPAPGLEPRWSQGAHGNPGPTRQGTPERWKETPELLTPWPAPWSLSKGRPAPLPRR
jgi:hypothetical protein